MAVVLYAVVVIAAMCVGFLLGRAERAIQRIPQVDALTTYPANFVEYL